MIRWVFFMAFCMVVVSADDNGPAMLEVCKGFHPHPPQWSAEYSFAYCKWKGVECDPKNHRVTSINISGLSLGGVISPAISWLPELSEVYVQNNKLTGVIPKLPKQVNLVYRPGNPRLRHSNNTTTGIIIGSVVGGALILIIISVVVYLLRKSTLENGRTGDDDTPLRAYFRKKKMHKNDEKEAIAEAMREEELD